MVEALWFAGGSVVFLLVIFAVSFYQGYRHGGTDTELSYRGLEYVVKENEVVCSHCSCSYFDTKEVLLNTTFASFIGLDWMNQSSTVLRCLNCGHLEWFSRRPKRK